MQLIIGEIYDGKVSGITNFGAFVSLPEGKTGMVHISEVSNRFVKEIRDVLTEDQEVKVKVIAIGDDGKISLSIKQTETPPENKNDSPKRSRQSRPDTWQGNSDKSVKQDMSFEDMMEKFKKVSDEKMTDLKRSKESKHGGGFSRGGNRKSGNNM